MEWCFWLKLISLLSDTSFPICSLDINSSNYFFWRYLKVPLLTLAAYWKVLFLMKSQRYLCPYTFILIYSHSHAYTYIYAAPIHMHIHIDPISPTRIYTIAPIYVHQAVEQRIVSHQSYNTGKPINDRTPLLPKYQFAIFFKQMLYLKQIKKRISLILIKVNTS